MFLATHYFNCYHTALAPLTTLKMSSMTPPDQTAFALAFTYKTLPPGIYSHFILGLSWPRQINTSVHATVLLPNVIFSIFSVYYHLIYMFLLTVSLLYQIVVYVSAQKTKVLNKYLLTEYNDQSVYLGLPKIIFLLGSEIINSVQRYIMLESCLFFWSLTSGRNIGSQSVFASRKFLLSFQT